MIQPSRMVWFVVCAAAVLLLPVKAAAQNQVTPNAQPPLTGTQTTVNNGTGDHSDPHVSGNLVSYSDSDGTNFTIRYHDLSTASDNGVPKSGTFDFLSDVKGNVIAFTRVSASAASIFTYTLGDASAVEVDPTPGSSRQSAQIGLNTIVWQEFVSGSAANIVVLNTLTNTKTVLTGGAGRLDQNPAVSPDGTAVAWESCATVAAPCDVWSATLSGAVWTPYQLTNNVTNNTGRCTHPDTNGSVVVYSCDRGGGDRLFWQPAAGGPENELNLAGTQSTPSISGQWVAFSGLAPGANVFSHNIFVYNLSTNNVYEVSNTVGDNELNDISITSDGIVNVVWQVQQTHTGGFYSVYAFSFRSSVEFAAFSAHAAINVNKKQFAVGGQFTLGNGSSGIDLSTQDVTLQLVEDHGPGNFSVTIPAGQGPGHFQNDGHGHCVFFGSINGVQLAASIGPFPGSTCQSANLGPYSYGFAGQGANNLPRTNTVTVTLTVGNNTGSKSVNAFFWPGSD